MINMLPQIKKWNEISVFFIIAAYDFGSNQFNNKTIDISFYTEKDIMQFTVHCLKFGRRNGQELEKIQNLIDLD